MRKRWFGVLGLLAVVALLVAACGGAASAPEAATGGGSADSAMAETPSAQAAQGAADDSTMMEDAGAMEDTDAPMMEDDAGSMGDADDSMMEDDAGSMGDADDFMMEDDSGALQDADNSMMEDDSGAMQDADDSVMEDDSGAMEDASGSMMEDDSEAMAADHAEDMMAEGEAEGSQMSEEDMSSDAMVNEEAMMDLPAWFSAELTDVNSGERLSVADLQGRVILVETMAIWCSNCLRQQQEVKALHEALGMRDDLVTLVLDIDPNENAENLKAYSAKHVFDWTYVVAPREVAREIGQLYGDQFLNPPSTPMLIVDRHGEVHLLPFGRKTAADLQEALAPFLSEDM